MIRIRNLVIVAAGVAALAGCAKPAPAPADTAADVAAIRQVNPAWFGAYKAGDADALAALYAEDATLLAPGSPPVHGRAAIHEYFVKDTAAMAAGGLTDNQGPSSDVGVSGDVGWESGTFTVTDQAGAAVDAGKYLTVYERKGGKWMIIRDTWNSDAAPAAPAAPEAPAASAPPG